jgi:hypothetical protein
VSAAAQWNSLRRQLWTVNTIIAPLYIIMIAIKGRVWAEEESEEVELNTHLKSQQGNEGQFRQ